MLRDLTKCVNKVLESQSIILDDYFYVLLTVHISINLGNDQLDTQLLDFTIRLL